MFLGLPAERATLLAQQAYAEAKSENWQHAAELYRAAAQADPTSVTAAYNAAAASRNAGELSLAVLYAEAALQIDPSHVLARQARDDIRRSLAGASGGSATRSATAAGLQLVR